MIFQSSRYAPGGITSVYFPASETVTRSTFRRPPRTTVGKTVRYYRWKDGDRIDRIAEKVYADPSLWWKIMDLNPEILDPAMLKPGDVVRLPVT